VTRRDPRAFGRKPKPTTSEQRTARRVAVACLGLFGISLTFSLTASRAHTGGAIVLGLAAFCFLIVAVVAAGES
jgi:hypothetical protein